MNDPKHPEEHETLVKAYEKIYQRVVDKIHNTKEKTGLQLHKLIDDAKEKEAELEQVSKQNAEKVADYLKRDMSDSASFLSETGKELKDWLGFETTLLQNEMLSFLQKAADPTTLAQLNFKLNAQPNSVYQSAEITGPGTLLCDHCGKTLYFHKVQNIPVCPVCDGTTFHRPASK